MFFPLSLPKTERVSLQTLASVCYAVTIALEQIANQASGLRRPLTNPHDHLMDIAHRLGLLGHMWHYPRKPWISEQEALKTIETQALQEAKALRDVAVLSIAENVRPRLQQLAKDIEAAAQKIHTLEDKVGKLLQPPAPQGTPDVFITNFFG